MVSRTLLRIGVSAIAVSGFLITLLSAPAHAATLSSGLTASYTNWMVERFAPALDFDMDGCLPAPAITDEGQTNDGIGWRDALNSGYAACREHFAAADVFASVVEQTSSTPGSRRFALLYDIYWESDPATRLGGGHTNDWEEAVVFVEVDGSQTWRYVGVAQSSHGNYSYASASNTLFVGGADGFGHPALVYHKDGLRTHALRKANSSDIARPENPTGKFWVPSVVHTAQLKSDNPTAYNALITKDWGSASFKQRDDATILSQIHQTRQATGAELILTPAQIPAAPAGGSDVGRNLITNSGFEADPATQTPAGWTEAWYNPEASYTEATWGSHSGTYHLTHWTSHKNYEESTLQKFTGLVNGTYTLTAWVQSSGGQNRAIMYAKGFGAAEKSVSLNNRLDSWAKVTISEIVVTNGFIEVGFYSKASGGQHLFVDDVEFYRTN